jgi:hypothetical protein
MTVAPYRRVLLKLSGESFARAGERGISMDEVVHIARQTVQATARGVELAVVILSFEQQEPFHVLTHNGVLLASVEGELIIHVEDDELVAEERFYQPVPDVSRDDEQDAAEHHHQTQYHD